MLKGVLLDQSSTEGLPLGLFGFMRFQWKVVSLVQDSFQCQSVFQVFPAWLAVTMSPQIVGFEMQQQLR